MPRWSGLLFLALVACGGAKPAAVAPTPVENGATAVVPPSATPPTAPSTAASGTAATPSLPPVVAVTTLPERPLIERRQHAQRANFDLVVRNDGAVAADLVKLTLSVRDRGGRLVLRRFLDANGFQPSLRGIGPTTVAPGKTIAIFNPLPDFDPELELGTLEYELIFNAVDGTDDPPDATVTIAVSPDVFTQRAAMVLPLVGRVLVFDGHDYHGHHRRLDVHHPVVAQLGIRHNFMRYGNDLVIVDDAGAMFRGDGRRNEDWYVFGAPLRSPAAGVVLAVENDVPDNLRDRSLFDPAVIAADPMKLFGNRVVIDHGHGEISMLGHLKQGSITVRVGDRVKAGQPVGAAGASGDAYIPHVHVELRRTAGVDGEGLPAYFRGLRRVVGARAIALPTGPIDSGEIVLSR
jgi:hypothetical protein